MNTDSDDIDVPTRAVPGDSVEPQANENQDGEAPDLPRNRSALARLSQSLPTLVVLGALATNSWGEMAPKGLWNAYSETPHFWANAVWCALFVGLGMAAVWAFPEESGAWRGVVAAMGFALGGAVAGAAFMAPR